MPVGLDIGTCFIVGCRQEGDSLVYKLQRDGFFTIEAETPMNARFIEQGLVKSGANFFRKESKFFVIGEEALEKALERRAVLQRPLHQGVINSREPEALEMIKHIIGGVLGEPQTPGEKCVYSVPEKPIDQEFDVVYHENILNAILSGLGYTGEPINEAEAVAYAELMDDGLTGLSISFGAGMCNFAVMSSGKSDIRFSVAKGGDWIDEKVALSLGLTPTLVQAEKEQNLNILSPSGKVQEALSIYYKHFVRVVVREASNRLLGFTALPTFSSPIPVAISGGTSMPEGFVEEVKAAFVESGFPIPISEVRRSASPLEAVAKGCYLAASL